MSAAPRSHALLAAGLLALTFAACGDDADPTTATPAGADAEGTTDGGGTVRFSLEDTDAVFIEGFEIGLRFVDADGEVIKSLLWNDYVASLDDDTLEAYYDSVLEQPVPAGTVTVEAALAMSIGGPIEPPDLEGPFPCSLDVDVADGQTVDVEMALTNEAGCLTVTADG